MSHDGNIGINDGLDGAGHLAAPFELDCLAVCLFEDTTGRFKCLPRRHLVAEKRQVGHDEGALRGSGHHFGMVDDLIDRHSQGRFPALDHRAERVADQDAIHAGRVDQPC